MQATIFLLIVSLFVFFIALPCSKYLNLGHNLNKLCEYYPPCFMVYLHAVEMVTKAVHIFCHLLLFKYFSLAFFPYFLTVITAIRTRWLEQIYAVGGYKVASASIFVVLMRYIKK